MYHQEDGIENQGYQAEDPHGQAQGSLSQEADLLPPEEVDVHLDMCLLPQEDPGGPRQAGGNTQL